MDAYQQWRHDNPLPSGVDDLPEKFRRKVLAQYQKAISAAGNAAYSGAHSDFGAGQMMKEILAFVDGYFHRMPKGWK